MKRPGRPPLDPADPSIDVRFALPSKQYAELSRQARAERVTVADYIRIQLKNLNKTNKPSRN